MKELFALEVYIQDWINVQRGESSVAMVTFGGRCECDFFKGEVALIGTDTQKKLDGKSCLSARYILKGVDSEGTPTKIFIENNSAVRNGESVTKPFIFTDNDKLVWLETADIIGKMQGSGDDFKIQFYEV